MFCYIFVIIFISILLIFQKDNRTSSKFLVADLLAYAIAIFSMILYLSKDTYYYNIVNNYFSLPKAVWKYFMFSDIPRNMMIRLLNVSSLAVIYLGYCFSLSYRARMAWNILERIKGYLLGILLIQLIIYDPLVQYKLYMLCYPGFLSSAQIQVLGQGIHTATVVINITIILVSILNLIHTYKKIYHLHFLRSYIIGEGIFYTLIMVSYMIIFWFSPAFLIKVSKIANYTSYVSVPLSNNQLIYTVFPYFLLFTELMCVYCVYEIATVKMKVQNKDYTITRQIDAADTTSKAFCHYMKNELLAIQAEIEMLDVTPENEEGVHGAVKRCQNLYERLDVIHRSTKKSDLNLVEVDIAGFIRDFLVRIKDNLKNCEVITYLDNDLPNVMLDRIYFEQAIQNIIDNAVDAMETIPEDKRKLIIRLQAVNSWIVLTIQDTGVGISKNNIKNIFTPLFSSKPIKKHWGIGLALTHRIIREHSGRIEVDSQVNVGTTFRILLPDINQILS